MTDPYQILGVNRDASDDEIKKAYRRLSRKYHPDANINNPNRDQAEERFKEVQQAYDRIMKEREYGYTGSPFGDFAGKESGPQDEEALRRQAAFNYVRNAHYQEARTVLDGLTNRNAEWYYLSAIAHQGLGNNLNAREHIRTAVSLEPGNLQYQAMQQQLENGGAWYAGRTAPFGGVQKGDNDVCLNVCLANMACNMCCPGSGVLCL